MPVTRVEDVLELFDLAAAPRPERSLGSAASALLARITDQPQTADELRRALGFEPSAAAAALTELELAGRVMLEDGCYRVTV